MAADDVLIVGGGLAGLSCAVRLRRAGIGALASGRRAAAAVLGAQP